mgnify:CR=1 FL=1
MEEKKLLKNYVTFLSTVMKENDCKKEIREAEDVLENLFYLSKEDGNGSRYIPLQYKRIVEKLICGMFNTAFDYDDKTDVYYDKIGDVTICCANVRWVQYAEDGSKKVLGHGYHAMALSEVFPGVFMSDEERVAKWKATVIGGAKSRALHDGGLGLEFYGDVYAPQDTDEKAVNKAAAEEPKKRGRKPKAEEKTYSESGMPIPKPKRAPAELPEAPHLPDEGSFGEKENVSEPKEEHPGMNIESARSVICDLGNYKGYKLGDIYNIAPVNLLYLVRRSRTKMVREAAEVIIRSDPELLKSYEAQ